MGDPVEAEHALVPLNARPGHHDVVAALGVVVVGATVSVEHVVARGVRVVRERGAVVALHQVSLAAALDPVVAVVTEDGVGRVAAEDLVVARAAEGLGRVGATDGEVVAATGLVQVEACTG